MGKDNSLARSMVLGMVISLNIFLVYIAIIKGAVNMNTLISVGSIAAILYGIYTLVVQIDVLRSICQCALHLQSIGLFVPVILASIGAFFDRLFV